MKKRSGSMKISEKYKHELAVYLPLAFVGGFLEIYTFLNMDGLFANSQTSNIFKVYAPEINSAYYTALFR